MFLFCCFVLPNGQEKPKLKTSFFLSYDGVMVDIIVKIKRHIEAQLPRAYKVLHSYIYLHIFRMELDTFMNDDICELISDCKI
jgi:hypothetical protein